ncbi:alpha/beta hydrolase [Thermoleophilia bacterium SCSIO 60948]|nr:alpha/beta hydrolase [Thermoleophilia bacterium SCSIO 60948]
MTTRADAESTNHFESRTAELTSGPVRYRDSGGSGPPILFVHGFLADGRLWDGVAAELAGSTRCIVADWPLGSHRLPMNPDADLSPPGVAELIVAFMDEIGVDEATVVGNDSGGAISQILATRHEARIESLVLTNCDMFERFPPFPFSVLPPLARAPGGMGAIRSTLRSKRLRRLLYGLLVEQPMDPALVDSWVGPLLSDTRIARDARKLMSGASKVQTLEAAQRLRGFGRPALLVWGENDPFFRLSDAERMNAMLPDSRLVAVESARAFSPLDRPEAVAAAIGEFVRARVAVG